MNLDKHWLALAAAIGATGVEVYCVYAAWGDARPPKLAPAVTPATPMAIPQPNVIDVLIDVVQPADRRKRVELEEIHRAYAKACKARGADLAAVEIFGAQAKAFSEAAGIRTLASNGKVYWCGIRLLA